MGTPTYAVPVLEGLTAAPGLELVGVYTPPDRPRGRGRSPQMPPVKERALAMGLPVYQPPSFRPENVREELSALQPDVIVVAAYGRLLPGPVLNTPPHGCLNIHPSLLPRYRGPSPIVSAILEGEASTGVTLMLLDEGMDTGPVIAQQSVAISSGADAETLTATLFRQGAELLLENLSPWVNGELTALPQDGTLATITSLVQREDGQADWQASAEMLERRCRAYSPWPGLFTHWQGHTLKLLDVQALSSGSTPTRHEIGEVVALSDADVPVGVYTGDGVLGLRRLQLEGRRPATAAEFIRGYPHFVGSRL